MSGRLFQIKKKVLKLLAKQMPGCNVRVRLLRMCGYEIGSQVYIGEDLLVIDDLEDSQLALRIGDRAAISPRVTFVLHSQPNEARTVPYVNAHKGPITIGADAWVGTGAVILPNITVGEGAVVGANAVVIRDVLPYTVVGGVPAHHIKCVDVPWEH